VEDQEIIRPIAERTGLTEAESWVFYHLTNAAEHWVNLPDVDFQETLAFTSSYNHLIGMLSMRVARRDHPAGWQVLGDVEGPGAES
jgi:hypothetical protein